ncbi:unnamed protein product, partial [Hapterophycus canaliculatus]
GWFPGQQGPFGQQGFVPTTPQGFGPNTPGGFGTPGTYGPPTPLGTPGYGQGFNGDQYPPAYSVMDPPTPFGFSGAMTTQQGWGQQPQPAYNSNGFANQMNTQAGFVGGSSSFGRQADRGSGSDFWNSAGIAGAGLAGAGLGAGLASTYNSAFGSGGAYGVPTDGFPNPAAAYGGPSMPPAPGKVPKKKGGGNKNKNKDPVTEQPVPGPVPEGWLAMPAGFELPDGIPKGLEV